jgi:tRNA pseudouridine55 synthase
MRYKKRSSKRHSLFYPDVIFMHGILIVNKPCGITSHDVVDVIRRRFGIKKVGHTGTLDPMARGVLVLLLGRATKLSSTFVKDDKEYIATLLLGKRTDTQDITGRVIEEKELPVLTRDVLEAVLQSFTGRRKQVPPMISAKKHRGRKLYELARRGKSVERSPVDIYIHDIRLLDVNLPEITFFVRCSKGTYVRTLCEEIGMALGAPACMASLLRTASGEFRIEEARGLDEVSKEDIRPV